MNIHKILYFILFICLHQICHGQTYYSASSGDWDKATTWTNSENGPGGFGVPEPDATIIIQNHHTVTLPGNYTTGSMPDEIAAHPTQGKLHFMHHGNLTINKGGIIQKIKGSSYVIFTGETNIKGAIAVNTRLYNLGEMIIFPEATADIEHELVLAGKSITAVDIDFKAKADIFFIGNHAALCGQGSILPEAQENVKIQEFDEANAVVQICEGFVIGTNDNSAKLMIEFR